jgi:hypothetical protein
VEKRTLHGDKIAVQACKLKLPLLADIARRVYSSRRAGGMNFAHSWHTMLVRQRGLALERSAMFYFREAPSVPLTLGWPLIRPEKFVAILTI